MNATQLLSRLRGLNVSVRVDGDHLRFSSPGGALTDDLRAELAAHKQELIEILKPAAAGAKLERADPALPVPMSFSQQRLWFLDQLESGPSAYNIPLIWRFRGAFNAGAMQMALSEIVRRHEVLRTSFAEENGAPVQRVSACGPVPLPVIKIPWPGRRRTRLDLALDLAREEAGRRIDLATGPVFRAKLARLAANDHLLMLNVHHIVFDAWSIGLFQSELASLYNAFIAGGDSPLPDLPVQYGDYAHWQHRWLKEPSAQNQLAYWRRQLSGRLPVIELPTDRPYPAEPDYHGRFLEFLLPKEVIKPLKALATREGATLFMAMLAAFKALLHAHTGQQDMIIGTAIANRARPELESLIGLFLNTLVLRTDLSGNPTFRELLGRVREVTLGAYANQEIPFEKLIEELNPARNLNFSPLFQVMFILQNAPRPPAGLDGLEMKTVRLENEMQKFDLNIHMAETDEGVWATWFYRTDLFEDSTIRRLASHYRNLLEAIAADPDRPIGALPFLTETERQPRAQPQPSGKISFPREHVNQSIAARFNQVVSAHGRRMAVKTPRHGWTYEALNARANQVANELLNHEAERVALLFEHDAPLVAAVLGTLKAGKAYIPLDPNYPPGRLQFMIEDARPQILLTNQTNHHLAGELSGGELKILDLDTIRGTVSASPPQVEVAPDALAYILYTSGSTGRPKGIMQANRNVNHFSQVYGRNLGLTPSDRLAMVASYSFDAAVMDIFGALLNGASLHPIDIRSEGLEGLADWMALEDLTVYHSTPSLFRYFCAVLNESRKFKRLRWVVLGGEAVFSRDLALLKAHFAPKCRLINGFGPTESTIALQFAMDNRTENPRHAVPIGYPVTDTEVLLLDDSGQPAQLFGEIAIRSPHLATGYWNRPELTERSFRADPAGNGRRTYLTGDLGRIRGDGAIEFVGRKDGQVKIRGHRIELGEIETRLLEHPHVKDAAVALHGRETGEGRLVAYIVGDRNAPPSAEELNRFLRRSLLEVMIPSAYVPMPSLPLTPTGKVDRRALPDPGGITPAATAPYVAPRNQVEQIIARAWTEVLGIERIGIHDNFFALGGHSLSAARLAAALGEAFRIEIPLRSIFVDPSIAGLAQYIEHDKRTGQYRFCIDDSERSSIVPMQALGSRRPFFLVAGAHADEDQFVGYLANLIPHLGLDQPVYGFKPRGLNGLTPGHLSVAEMAADYINELRAFQPEGPYLLGGECVGGIVAYEMAQQLWLQGAKVGLLVLMDTPRPDRIRAMRYYIRFAKRKFILGLTHLRNMLQPNPRAAYAYLTEYLRRKRKLLLPLSPDERRRSNIRHVENLYPRLLFRYRPQPYPGKMTLIVNREQYLRNPSLGWQKIARGGVEIHMVPGNHLTRLTMYGRLTADCLRACIDRAQSDGAKEENIPVTETEFAK